MEADDDDCKYHVKWTSSPICEGDGSATSPGVRFTVTITYLVGAGDAGQAGGTVTGANTKAEVFTATPGDQDSSTYCDNASLNVLPAELSLAEDPANPGTYSGIIPFNQPGEWTVRFHIHEECYDVPSSPHGHAAFHVMVP